MKLANLPNLPMILPDAALGGPSPREREERLLAYVDQSRQRRTRILDHIAAGAMRNASAIVTDFQALATDAAALGLVDVAAAALRGEAAASLLPARPKEVIECIGALFDFYTALTTAVRLGV